jgi:hypothetical protein|tara:strand:- start:521 stop:739 length:219 start_codon:yes stop_codon:yes gene_type:complete
VGTDGIEYQFAVGDLVRDQTNSQAGVVIEVVNVDPLAGLNPDTEYLIRIVWQHTGEIEQLPDWYAEEILSIL